MLRIHHDLTSTPMYVSDIQKNSVQIAKFLFLLLQGASFGYHLQRIGQRCSAPAVSLKGCRVTSPV